jgi:hypothetical protein
MTNEAKVRKDLRDFAKSLGSKAYRVPIDPGVRRGGKLDEFWIVDGHGVGIIILEDDALLTKSLSGTMEKIQAANGFVFVIRSSSNESLNWFKTIINALLHNPFVETKDE